MTRKREKEVAHVGDSRVPLNFTHPVPPQQDHTLRPWEGNRRFPEVEPYERTQCWPWHSCQHHMLSVHKPQRKGCIPPSHRPGTVTQSSSEVLLWQGHFSQTITNTEEPLVWTGARNCLSAFCTYSPSACKSSSVPIEIDEELCIQLFSIQLQLRSSYPKRYSVGTPLPRIFAEHV